jgi:hypothetical protein
MVVSGMLKVVMAKGRKLKKIGDLELKSKMLLHQNR